jgi:diacylglycerol kinase (ATP)
MSDSTSVAEPRTLIVINSRSGGADLDALRRAVAEHFAEGACHIHELAEGEDIGAVARAAAGRGVAVIAAAGGDGTVSAVANGVLGTDARLGIIPLGTSNVLARELGIPLDVEGACRLLAGPHETATIDAMRVGEAHYFTQVGIGVNALVLRDTATVSKKRFGSLAYAWTTLTRLVGFQPLRFTVSADGRKSRPSALQIMVANCSTFGTTGLRWGPHVRADDGRLDVCIVRARTLLDYLQIAWSFLRGRQHRDPHIRYLPAARAVAVATAHPIPYQADGEIVGRTPVEVEVAPAALRVVVPPPAGNGA